MEGIDVDQSGDDLIGSDNDSENSLEIVEDEEDFEGFSASSDESGDENE